MSASPEHEQGVPLREAVWSETDHPLGWDSLEAQTWLFCRQALQQSSAVLILEAHWLAASIQYYNVSLSTPHMAISDLML